MSNANVAKLEGINKVLRFNSIFLCVGVFFIIALQQIVGGFNASKVMSIGWIIIGLPKIISVLFGGLGAAIMGPLKADYEVVTVDGLGRTISSDGGAQSMQVNFLIKLIQIGVILAIGGIFTILHVIILSIRYAAIAFTTKAKSSVIPTGNIIILINLIVFVGSIFIAVTHQNVKRAVSRAERGVITTGDFRSELNVTKDARMIESYEGKGGAVIIPDTINGLPVIAIGSSAFSYSDITSIVIPEGVTDIENFAFRHCAALTSVTLPKSIQRIGSESFADCPSLTDVIIPSGFKIKYGSYMSGIAGTTHIETIDAYFQEGKDTRQRKASAFNGSSNLSAASQEIIIDSGYDGDF